MMVEVSSIGKQSPPLISEPATSIREPDLLHPQPLILSWYWTHVPPASWHACTQSSSEEIVSHTSCVPTIAFGQHKKCHEFEVSSVLWQSVPGIKSSQDVSLISGGHKHSSHWSLFILFWLSNVYSLLTHWQCLNFPGQGSFPKIPPNTGSIPSSGFAQTKEFCSGLSRSTGSLYSAHVV